MPNNQDSAGSNEQQPAPTQQEIAAALVAEVQKGAGNDFVVTSIRLDGEDVS
ncbi:hypothetical protein NE236_19590 [Actinoallomurus purpureus]|uniref:hypothetical protein n=1 Tax=Actinoallomurus purpureus TaxID=478114 RepID=UPI00209280A1|nr:hypothetical protein [Actinoallomurus purpureus]MCO6007187.1 hypothetical protein [Actinoallomurus purpureus]